MILKTIVWGAQASFVPDGKTETISMVSHTVGELYVPAFDSVLFENIGDVPKLDLAKTTSDLIIRAPQKYRYGRRKRVILSQDMKATAELADWSPLALQALFGLVATPAEADDPVKPFSQTTPVTGWLLLEQGDETNTKLVQNIWRVEMDVEKQPNAEKQYTYMWVIDVLTENPLNTFELPSFT